MQRDSLKDIGQVIKAHSTEKSIDELRAQGKKRVRVVSGQRVMEIIQAVVDDTISQQVGEITQRDRDRIVEDTRSRFDRVLRLQTDLEAKVTGLREQLRDAEIERESLRTDKGLLESQLESARSPAAEPEALQRVSRELSRMRESLEAVERRVATVDDAAVTRLSERLAARDEQHERSFAAEMKDVRRRLEALARDTAKAKDALSTTLLRTVEQQRGDADRVLSERLEREFGAVHDRIERLRKQGASGPVPADLGRLRGDLDALEHRLRGVESTASELADDVAARVLPRVDERADHVHRELGAEIRTHVEGLASALVAVEETLADDRRIAALAIDSVRSAIEETRALAETAVDAVRDATVAAEIRGGIEALGERLSELTGRVEAIDARSASWVDAAAQRVAESVVVDEEALRDSVTRVAARVDDRIDEIVASVREANEARAADVTEIAARLVALELVGAEDRELLRDTAERSTDHGAILMRIESRAADDHAAIRELAAEASADRMGLRKHMASVTDERAGLRTAIESAIETAGAALTAENSRRTFEAVDALRAELSERQDALVAVVHDGVARLDGQICGLAERMDGPAEAVANALAALRSDVAARPEGVPEALHDLVAGLRDEIVAVAERTAAAQSALESRVEKSVRVLRDEIVALAGRQADADASHGAALRELGERMAEASSAQAASLGRTFDGALDQALDKITRTMEAATARPIDITVEATDVLLDKLFDGGADEMVSNLDELEVEERAAGGVGKTLGRLRALHGPGKTGTDD